MPTSGQASPWKACRSPSDNIDLVVVRENLEGMYCGVEFDTGTAEAAEVIDAINERSKKQVDSSAAISIKIITAAASRRIVRVRLRLRQS